MSWDTVKQLNNVDSFIFWNDISLVMHLILVSDWQIEANSRLMMWYAFSEGNKLAFDYVTMDSNKNCYPTYDHIK